MAHRPLSFLVSDLLGRAGAHRDVTGTARLDLEVGNAVVEGPVELSARLESLPDGVLVRGRVQARAQLECNRCGISWETDVEADLVHLLTHAPDEDGYRVARDGHIDLEPLVRDEVATSLPLVGLCRPDCAGLCPVCGTDLNTDPCEGHSEAEVSPFAALKKLFDS